jgi:F0F1-type ATP synthase assembly protein I
MDELTTNEILKLIVPIVMIGIAFMVRKNDKMEGRLIKWWVLLVLGIILLIFRLVRLFHII